MRRSTANLTVDHYPNAIISRGKIYYNDKCFVSDKINYDLLKGRRRDNQE